MEIMAALEAFRDLERRGIEFYRTLGERVGDERSARLWRECMHTEASHQTIFMLCLDWAHMWRWTGPKPDVPVDAADLAREADALTALEAEAGQAGLTAAAALDVALRWEERELSRLLLHRPPRSRTGQGPALRHGEGGGGALRRPRRAGEAGGRRRGSAGAARGDPGAGPRGHRIAPWPSACAWPPSGEIPAGTGKGFDVAGRLLAVFHVGDGRYYATSAVCPHEDGPLDEGLLEGAPTGRS